MICREQIVGYHCLRVIYKMSDQDSTGELEEIFELLVTSYAQKGGVIPGESDLSWKPATDAYETADEFIVQVDLAGMDPSQIEVLADDKMLLVRGIRPDTSGPGKKHFHKIGRASCRERV